MKTVQEKKTEVKWLRLRPSILALVEEAADKDRRPVAWQLAKLICEALAARGGGREWGVTRGKGGGAKFTVVGGPSNIQSTAGIGGGNALDSQVGN